jgi:hypothetical protein
MGENPPAGAEQRATAATDFAHMSFSESSIGNSMIFSIPPAPITAGTPTYMSLMPYWPVKWQAQAKTRFLSFRKEAAIAIALSAGA